jgi:L-lactate dehydrogenase complex protein LldF
MSVRVGEAAQAPDFPTAAKKLLANTQLRHNVRHATDVIRAKRARVVGEMRDWQELRECARQVKEYTLQHLDSYLEQFEDTFTRAGGHVHWARDADEANGIVVEIIKSHNEKEVIKVKTMTSDEICLNAALEAAGITPYETDLADLIVQLGEDRPSHIVVPALHRNRMEIRRIFLEKMKLGQLGDRPEDLTNAARRYLREKFLRVKVGVSGANFAIAETGPVCVVESEGNGRMCVSLPRVLISLIGIEKVIPRFADLEVFLQLLPRSATGESMNPYNSIWTGVAAGDGPQEFHVVLLDNGRTSVLADSESRETLNCIRCGACLNACPVYRQTGGHAYGSVYSGPIGAILTPQLQSMEHSQSLPYASSLCGACYEVCPVQINIPEILIHLRGKVVDSGGAPLSERLAMKMAAFALSDSTRLSGAQKLARIAQWPFEHDGLLQNLPGRYGGGPQSAICRPFPKSLSVNGGRSGNRVSAHEQRKGRNSSKHSS